MLHASKLCKSAADLVHRRHAVSSRLVRQVQSSLNDSDLIMGQIASQALLEAMSIHQSLQLCPPEQSLHAMHPNCTFNKCKQPL